MTDVSASSQIILRGDGARFLRGSGLDRDARRARPKFPAHSLADAHEVWETHGRAALEELAETDPGGLRACNGGGGHAHEAPRPANLRRSRRRRHFHMIIAANEVLVSDDVTEGCPLCRRSARAGEGHPLLRRGSAADLGGLVISTLCVIDTRQREFPELDCQSLQDMADELMCQIERLSAEDTDRPQADLVTGASTR